MKSLKTLYVINWLKKLMLFKLLMKEISLKTVYNTKIKQGEEKIHNQDNHVTTSELNKFSSDILDGKLKEAKLEAKKFLKTVSQRVTKNEIEKL